MCSNDLALVFMFIVFAADFRRDLKKYFSGFSEFPQEGRSDALKGYQLKQLAIAGNRGGHNVRRVEGVLYRDNLFTMATRVPCSPRPAY